MKATYVLVLLLAVWFCSGCSTVVTVIARPAGGRLYCEGETGTVKSWDVDVSPTQLWFPGSDRPEQFWMVWRDGTESEKTRVASDSTLSFTHPTYGKGYPDPAAAGSRLAGSQRQKASEPLAPTEEADGVSREGGLGLALLIGINTYDIMGELECCRQDAELMRRTLLDQGGYVTQSVVVLTDDATVAQNRATLANLTRRIQQVCRLAKEEDALLIYFAGHGITVNGHSYLVPQDGGDEKTSIAVAWMQEEMRSSKARSKALILDACHSGKATRGVMGISPSLEQEGLFLLASCKAEEISYPENGQGVFTRFLAKGLSGAADANENGEIVGDEIYAYVRTQMDRWCLKSGKTQRPQMLPENGGDVVITKLK